jgi:SAM-dependent methyltransferase
VSVDRRLGIHVPGDAYPYLQMQRGAISDMRGDYQVWLQYYTEALFSEFDLIEPYLPLRCDSILDVGSGLGGIDALLNQHYGGDCRITLLDGVDDKPFVQSHSKTFNHMGIARQFLNANGVTHFDYIDANGSFRSAPRFFDLVISFKSWCFHYEPERYLTLVKSACISGQTKLIVDVRRDEPAWSSLMRKEFTHLDTIYMGSKFYCAVFQAR